MTFNKKNFALFSFIVVTSVSFAQYKYDIGVKASSYDLERFQLEQRFHFDSPYSLVVTFVSGATNDGYSTQSGIYNDSLYDVSSSYVNNRNGGLKLGVQRKLGFFATDVFYAGATLGMGFEKERTSNYFTTYSNPNGIENDPFINYTQSTQISFEAQEYLSSMINSQLALSFGMDVPLSKRFVINAELGFASMFSRSLTYDFSSIELFGTISGGVRYQFGVRK